MSKTKGRPLRTPNPFTRCHWPRCNGDVRLTMAPLCFEHLTESHRIFCNIADDLQADSARRNAEAKAEPRITQGLVYFVHLGNRVKIGYTTNMRARMVVIPHEEVLGTTPGTMADEKRCHTAFAHLREQGEWFRAEPDLLAFIADVAAGHGG